MSMITVLVMLLGAVLAATAGQAWTSDGAGSAQTTRVQRTVVTPDVLLEHVSRQRPEISALAGVSWVNRGRALVIVTASAESMQQANETVPTSIVAVDSSTGRVRSLGYGDRPSTAVTSDIIAYFIGGSRDRRIALARSDGTALCTLDVASLMPDATRVQAIAVKPDGARLALAVELPPPGEPASPTAEEDRPRVRVFDGDERTQPGSSAALWLVDRNCRNQQRVGSLSSFRIGRLSWASSDRSIVAMVATTNGAIRNLPRSDLIEFDLRSGRSRTIISNIGEQARQRFELLVSPDGDLVAFTYDEDGLPYRLRKQLAIASLRQRQIRVISTDPRQAAGWLDSNTLLITRSAAHDLLARSATLGLDGIEREVDGPSGRLIPSPDGTVVASIESDLYGNSTLWVAPINRAGSRVSVGERRALWRRESPLNRFAQGRREFIYCEISGNMRIPAILVLPLDYEAGRRYPMIVDLHGGPGGGLISTEWPYQPGGGILNLSTIEHDMWAARGYVVLAPDFRASGYYGFELAQRDQPRFEQDFQDVMCNVDAAIARGVADPERMAIIGHSYGGTLVNWAVTHSQRFAAAITKEGSFNVNYAVSWGVRGEGNSLLNITTGSPIEFPERYRRESVMESVRGVTTPTLFSEYKGGNRPGQLYSWMYAAWRHQGVDAQLRLYDEPQHVLRRPADQRDMLFASIEWIERYLAAQ